MTKTLVAHGNSAALIIDKPILDILKVDMNTPLEITTDERALLYPLCGGRAVRNDSWKR